MRKRLKEKADKIDEGKPKNNKETSVSIAQHPSRSMKSVLSFERKICLGSFHK